MAELAERALVRIFRDREPVGVGFLVADDLVLTCAHVIGEREDVELDFPVLGGDRVTARVVHRADDVDVAGLRLAVRPPGARAVRVVAPDEIRGHRVRTFGVSDARPAGVWSQGVVRGAIAGGRIHIEDDRAHGLPMLQGFSGGPVIDDDLGAVVGMVTEVEARRAHRIGYALSGAVLHDAWPALAEAGAQPTPFRGLEPFQSADAEYFFGRDGVTDELAGRLDRDGAVVVAGPSGCGKSSLVLAGLLPALDAYPVVVRSAGGSTPFAALAAALDEDEVPPDRIADALNRALVRRDLRRLVVVLDQFDEALTRLPEETAALLHALLDTVESHRRTPRVDLVVTATTASLYQLLGDPRFGSRLGSHTFTLGAPSTAELREIAEGPLAPAGMPVLQDGLADALLDDLVGERNPLPMLEFTLTLLWERQERGVLTHRAYRELGGVAGAVSTYAEQVCRGLDPVEIRRALTQLVSPLEDGGYVRRVVPRDQLGPVVVELARTRLVTVHESTVELVHEALIRHWGRLREWVEEDRDFRLWQDEVNRQARRWHESRDAALLLRGRALRQARRLAAHRRDDLTGQQRSFLVASTQATIQAWATIAVVIGLLVGVTAVAAIAMVRFTNQETEAAVDQAAQTLLRRAGLGGPADKIVETVRAYRTTDHLETREYLRSLARSLRYAEILLTGDTTVSPGASRIARQTDGEIEIWDVTATPHKTVELPVANGSRTWAGDNLLVTTDGAQLTVWDARDGRRVRTVAADARSVAADPGGRFVAHAGTDSTEVHLLDLRGGERTLTAPGRVGRGVILSGVLASGEVLIDHVGKRWALGATGTRELSHAPFSEHLARRPEPTETKCDRNRLVMVGAFSGRTLATVAPGELDCASGAYSPDVASFASVDRNDARGPALLRFGTTDPAGSRRIAQVPYDSQVTAVAVEPSGAYRVVLDLKTARMVLRIPAPDGLDRALESATEAAFTPDGRHIVLLWASGRVEVWNRESRIRTGQVDGRRWQPKLAWAFSFSPDSATLALRERDTPVVTLWNLPDLRKLADVRHPDPVSTDPGPVFSVPLFLDADRLAIIRGAEVSVWAARSGDPIGGFTAPTAWPWVVAVGADELAVMTVDKRLHRYRIVDGTEVPNSEFPFGDPDTDLIGTPPVVDEAGELLAVYHDNAVEVWDLAKRERVDRIQVPDSWTVMRLTFRADPDELEIALAETGGASQAGGGVIVQLWTRNLFWGLPGLVGRDGGRTEFLARPAEPGYANAGTEYGGVESGDPQVWLGTVCDLVRRSGIDRRAVNPPPRSYEGLVC